MGVFHVFKIVQMVPNRATRHKYHYSQYKMKPILCANDVENTGIAFVNDIFRNLWVKNMFEKENLSDTIVF